MIKCQNCQHEEPTGAIFCSECGAQLHDTKSLTTHNIQSSAINSAMSSTSPFKSTLPMPSNAVLALHFLDLGQMVPLLDGEEFTLGRISEGQPIMPDVDLTPFSGYQLGVSRLHAVIKKQNQATVIVDLGSSNGTYLNGLRLEAQKASVLNHGDIISLGKLKIQVLFP